MRSSTNFSSFLLFGLLVVLVLNLNELNAINNNNYYYSSSNEGAYIGANSIQAACQSGLREDNTNYIYCARQNLTRIPALIQVNGYNGAASGSMPNVLYDELVLSDNMIERIEADSFGTSLKAKKIYLDQNPLRFIDAKAFDYVRNYLEELYFEQKSFNNDEQQPPPFTSDLIIELPSPSSSSSDLKLLNSNFNSANQFASVDDDAIIFEKSIFQTCSNLRLLSIKNYEIKYLKANTLARLIRLEVLTFTNNRLRRINEAAFNGLENNLIELNLDSNYLEWIPTRPLEKLRKLRRLTLSQNRIRLLHSNSFFRLSSLSVLDLSYNYLNRLDENAFNGPIQTTLKSLQLQNNELKWSHFVHLLFNLHVLQELNIDFNKLATITPFTQQLIQQSSSSLRRRQFYKDDVDVDSDSDPNQKFINLKLSSLSMQGNSLSEATLSLFTSSYSYESLIANINNNNNNNNNNNKNIDENSNSAASEMASAASNYLKSEKRLQFSNLLKLNLARNKIGRIPEKFFLATNMSQLRILTFDKNPFQARGGIRERSFAGLESSLNSLSLNGVGFNLWSPAHFRSLIGLDNLKILKLNANGNAMGQEQQQQQKMNIQLSKLDLDEMQNNSNSKQMILPILPNLVALELQNNKLKSIPEFLCNLNNLIDLDLSSNQLTSFNSNCLLFKSSSTLLSINQADNGIGSMHATKLKQINLNNNPLRCDCHMRQLKLWLMRNYDRDLLEFVKWQCAEPFELNGRYLSNVNLNELICEESTMSTTTTTTMPSTIPFLPITSNSFVENLDDLGDLGDLETTTTTTTSAAAESSSPSMMLTSKKTSMISSESSINNIIFHPRQTIEASSSPSSPPIVDLNKLNINQNFIEQTQVIRAPSEETSTSSVQLKLNSSNVFGLNSLSSYSLMIGISFGVCIVCFTLFFIFYARFMQKKYEKSKNNNSGSLSSNSSNSSTATSTTADCVSINTETTATTRSKNLLLFGNFLQHSTNATSCCNKPYDYEKKSFCSPCTSTASTSSSSASSSVDEAVNNSGHIRRGFSTNMMKNSSSIYNVLSRENYLINNNNNNRKSFHYLTYNLSNDSTVALFNQQQQHQLNSNSNDHHYNDVDIIDLNHHQLAASASSAAVDHHNRSLPPTTNANNFNRQLQHSNSRHQLNQQIFAIEPQQQQQQHIYHEINNNPVLVDNLYNQNHHQSTPASNQINNYNPQSQPQQQQLVFNYSNSLFV